VDLVRTTLARAAPPVRALALVVVLVGLAFAVTTLPHVRAGHPGFWVPVDGWLQGTGYALMALLILLRPVLVPEARALWWLLAAAVALRALGFLVYFTWVRTLVPQPYPSAADPLWLAASVVFVVAIATLAGNRGYGLSRLLVLDGVIAGLTVAGLFAALLHPTLLTLVGPDVPPRAVVLNVVYPILDVVALVLIAGLLASGWRPNRAEGLVVTGIAIFALIDSVYLYQVAAGTFRPGTVLSALSYLGTAVVAVAAWLTVPDGARTRVAGRVALPPRAPVAVPAGLAAVAMVGVLVMAYADATSRAALGLLMLALGVTIVRGVLTLLQDREEADVVIASRTRETARYQSLVEASGDFVLIATLDGRVTFVNPAGRRMIGLDADRDVRATSLDEYLTPDGRRAFDTLEHPAVLAHGHWEGQSTLRDLRGGPPIPVTVASFFLYDPDTRQPFALATVQRDISELVAAERATARLAEQRRRLLGLLVEVQEDERSRIAADVHDDSVQALAAVDLRLSLVRRQLAGADVDPATLASLELAHETVNDATDRLRHLLFDLESPAQRADLPTALREAATFLLEEAGVRWRVTGDTDLDLSPGERVTAYRVAKEAMVNVRKHARATSAEIRLDRHEGGLLLTVTDDGGGVDPTTLHDRPGHLGIAGMRDRAEIAGGRLQVSSVPGQGTEVRLWIPHQVDTA
jgi:PAS domain S-box-containing protein